MSIKMVNLKMVNWPGLACAVTISTLLLLSFLYVSPWWQVEIGDNLARADISPLDYSANLIGMSVGIPIIWFITLISKLMFVACAVAFFIYSVATQKSYSKNLLNFAYKKPIITFILFVVTLVGASYVAQSFIRVNVPLSGTSTINTSTLNMPIGEFKADMPISTGFTWVFWLAAATTVLALVAKIYDWKIIRPALPTTPPVKEPQETKAPEAEKAPEEKKTETKKSRKKK